MPRRFALDQNFPEPIVDGLVDWLASDAELTPIRRIDKRMAALDDWEVLHALHTDARAWDGLITTDAKMLSLPRELAVLCQTKLTLVAAEAVGHDPIKATGLVLAHITRICEQTRVDTAQVWRLRTSTKPAETPWDFLSRLAERRGRTAPDLYASERLKEDELGRSPLG
ncbi:MAG TPA: hypothetical protein VGO80_19680 [Solirubrobacteraceae bacterium]|nr:hypothetical protein [Solirubrobacteraceae bacterium]